MGTLQYGVINLSVLLAKEPLADRLETASLNTVLGLLIVFAVLILISLLISCFKIIPYLQNKRNSKTQETNTPVDNVIAQIVEQEEEELKDDLELVAVITAAIYASMGVENIPADGLIVRSIRKVNSRRRVNA